MIDPILIMATPRSGSSMTAGIFAAHGVWTGRVREGEGRNPKGFFESRTIRAHIVEHFGRRVKSGRVCERLAGWRARIEPLLEAEGYDGGPWLWKGSAIYWPAWHEWPNPKWVVVRRDKDATIRSLQKPPYALATTDEAELARLVDLHHAELDKLVAEHGAFEVDAQAVALGDFTSIARALTGCGLDYREDIVDDFVEKDQWHHVA